MKQNELNPHPTSNEIDVSVQVHDVEEAKSLLVRVYISFPEARRREKNANKLFARAFELVGQVGKKAGAVGFAEVIRELIRILRE